MIQAKMSVIQRIYWTLSEMKDQSWPMGTRIPVYQSPGQFAYWLVALEDDVRLVTPHGDSMECGGIVPYVLILKLNRGVWEEVYNWEDGVRKILKDNNLPEEV